MFKKYFSEFAKTMFKKNKILIISILTLITLPSFLFYQKIKENKLLNTYHNQTYNYSFQYPKYLKQSAHCSGNDNPVFINKYPQSFEADAISVVTSPTIFANLDKWLEKENEYWQKHDQKRVVEKRLKIDGNKALVTYLESSYPNSEISNQSQVVIEKGQSKKTVFIKDNVLFEINTRFVDNQLDEDYVLGSTAWNKRLADHQKIWHSFKIADFTKKNIDSVPESLYVNHKYSYYLNYGDNLRIDEFCFGDDSNVSLSSIGINLPFNLVHIVVLENTEFKTIKQWQEAENAKSDDYYQKFERNILIDNYPAQVFYSYGKDEDISYDKRTVFIKDNNLFIIYTRGDELSVHQKIWDNFKFIENSII